MVTIKDIAERLGISISTVSKGLHGASDISEEMRQQVLDTAIAVSYTHLRAHETDSYLVCRLLLEKKKTEKKKKKNTFYCLKNRVVIQIQ